MVDPNLILVIIFSYLLGSVLASPLIVKWFTEKNIRKVGSRNPGTLNTFRSIKQEKSVGLAVLGFLLALIADVGKAALAVFFAQNLIGSTLSLAVAGAFVVLGHNYPFHAKFKGGRGAACLIGIFLYINPLVFLIWGGSILLFSILAEFFFRSDYDPDKSIIGKVFYIIRAQMLGRMLGIVVAPLPIYFYDIQAFYVSLVPTILLIIANYGRLRDYLNRDFKNRD